MTEPVPVTSTSPRVGQISGGERRREGSGAQFSESNQRGRGMRRTRGERRGQRGARGDSNQSSITPEPSLGTMNARSLDQSANNGAGLDIHMDAETLDQGQAGQESVRDQDKPAEEGKVCFICALTIKYLSITPCNHQTCHICALRLRALYKKRDCVYCKVSNNISQVSEPALTSGDRAALCDIHR